MKQLRQRAGGTVRTCRYCQRPVRDGRSALCDTWICWAQWRIWRILSDMTAPQLHARDTSRGGVPGDAKSWIVVDQSAIEALGVPRYPALDDHERASILRAEQVLMAVLGAEGWTPRIVHRRYWHRGPVTPEAARERRSTWQSTMPW